jgi:hypothetical protein
MQHKSRSLCHVLECTQHSIIEKWIHGVEEVTPHTSQADPLAFGGSCHNGRLHCMIRSQLCGTEATEKKLPARPR